MVGQDPTRGELVGLCGGEGDTNRYAQILQRDIDRLNELLAELRR
jgi:hypothetical protein